MAQKPSKPDSTQGDDRNLVAVDDSYAGASFEDRLYLFWEKYKGAVVLLCIALVVIIVGREGLRIWADVQDSRVQATFAEAATPEELRAFATDHRGHPLAGLALLDLADQAYRAGSYHQAAQDYSAAAAILTEPSLKARARMGEAVSHVRDGATAAAEPVLEGLARDASQLLAIRSEAHYHLAVLAREAGDYDRAREKADAILDLNPGGFWANRAQSLRTSLPPQES